MNKNAQANNQDIIVQNKTLGMDHRDNDEIWLKYSDDQSNLTHQCSIRFLAGGNVEITCDNRGTYYIVPTPTKNCNLISYFTLVGTMNYNDYTGAMKFTQYSNPQSTCPKTYKKTS